MSQPQPCTLPARLPDAGPASHAASHAAYLPPVPRPPHDPLTLVLNGQLGWRVLPGKPPAVPAATIGPLGECGALTLLPLPGSGRTLLEASGSFGGLVLPRHMALASLGPCQQALLLFDAKNRRLLRFDPCACVFAASFCLRAQDPRLPSGPAALAASCGRLYLADPAGRRVIVLNAATGAARGVWRAPLSTPPCDAGSGLDDWQPAALAVAPNGDIWVGDRINGLLLRFSPTGCVVERHHGFGAVAALAATCDGRLLVAGDGAAAIVYYDPSTRRRLDAPLRPADLADAFAPLPLTVHADGSVDLSALCSPPCAAPCVFDPSGNLLDTPPDDPPDAWPATGTWYSQALDSGISECVWDRIVLGASLPAHTRLAIDVLTAETELPPSGLFESGDWQAALALHPEPDGSSAFDGIDYMLQARPGRYLWLRLRLDGNGSGTPSLACLALDFPRISWRRYLPAMFGAEPVSAEFTDRWLALFDRQFRDIEQQIDRQARLFDPLSAPAGGRQDFLGFLAGWLGLGNGLSALPLARQRAFIKHAARAFAWRGTPRGLTHTLYLFLGLQRWCGYAADAAACVPCATDIPARFRWRPPRLLLEHYLLRRWLFLGFGRLSDNARLWGERIVNRGRLGTGAPPAAMPGCPLPAGAGADDCEPCVGASHAGRHGAASPDESARIGVTQLKTAQDPWRDPFHVYAHKLSVFVPAACVREPALARALAQLLKADVPAHVQATLVPVEPRFRIGVQAMLGLDAVIGYRAAPVTLDAMKLGRATVLGSADRDGGARALRVGTRRVGMDTTMQ
ncbi:hypothetical protein [Cupriavidus sp. UYPR2.512]|uniref:hypothetical protein n=1 Tax=Cupriavidus sp. UYPR2.512 TaxID=1080187 RepID=UPI00035FFA62|nr:hypothetical protein [Cupriavidus sp. UYPR2.512]UIF91180.1 hypothetical protein KAF44_34105 [Cupriavidus necator]